MTMQLSSYHLSRGGWLSMRLFSILLLSLLLGACSATRMVADPTDKMTIKASADCNPDMAGRPSPIMIKVLELSSRTTFDSLDFDAAWGNTQVVLSDQLLSATEFVLLPHQEQRHRIELHPDARFVAVIAAYRDIDRARWKLIYPVKSNWFQKHRILLSARAVVLEK